MPTKGTIEEMRKIARQRGGECLSDTYLNSVTYIRWCCSHGHEWEATPGNIKAGKWCPFCAGRGKTIGDMRELALKRGGKCLSSEYRGGKRKLLWECSCGHSWKAAPTNVARGTWCPACHAPPARGLNDAKAIAADRGGECLSSEYRNNSTLMDWRCSEGHEWRATYGNISKGKWCRKCAHMKGGRKRRGSIEQMKPWAKAHGGECLSTEYETAHSNLQWRCKEGHEWEASPSNIKAGKWCPYCAGRIPLTISDLKQTANEKGGQLLSKEVVNARTKVRWRCEHGHEWEQIPDAVRRGSWCPLCAANAPVTLDDLQETAEARGGRLIASSIKNTKEKLEWECSHGHRWKASSSDIRSGRWCPKCSEGLGERICRAFFEQLFNAKFEKVRPEWLTNEAGNQMELDGYSEVCALAFEHQGTQHFKFIKRFHGTNDRFQQRQRDDQRKVDLCKAHGIRLIAVPEIPAMLPTGEVKQFIQGECEAQGVPIPRSFGRRKVDLRKAYVGSRGYSQLTLLRGVAEGLGGRLLSTHYRGTHEKLEWECSEGHRWEAVPSAMKQGHWCPKCSIEAQTERQRLGLSAMRELAREKGGRCLSKSYTNAHAHLRWRCSKGHEWTASAAKVKYKGRWCPVCRNRS